MPNNAEKYIVTREELAAIADEIRNKTGDSNELTFPDDFTTAIRNIPSESFYDYSKFSYMWKNFSSSGNEFIVNQNKWWSIQQPYNMLIPLTSVTKETGNYTKLMVDWSKSFELKISTKYYSHLNHAAVVFGCSDSGLFYKIPSIEFSSNGGGIWCGLSTNGSDWTYNISFTTEEIPIISQMEYTFLLIYDESTSKVIFSVSYSNGNTEKEIKTKTVDVSSVFSGSSFPISFFDIAQSYNHAATNIGIDFLNTYIKSDNELIWGVNKL